MGEPFRARSASDDTFVKWFRQADRNRDGTITLDEMQADAERFYATLDTDHDGEIGPEELIRYEWEIAPDIQVMSKTRPAPGQSSATARQDEDEDGNRRRKGNDYGLQGAARYALLNIPEPVAAADANFDRGITLAEFRNAAVRRFRILDRERQGRLTLAELQALLPSVRRAGYDRKHRKDAPDMRIGNPLPPGD